MKKKQEELSPEQMRQLAEDRTVTAKGDAEIAVELAWEDTLKSVWGKGSLESFVERATCLFAQLGKSLEERKLPGNVRFMLRRLAPVLSFNFHYDYSSYEWNGTVLQDDDEAFTEDVGCDIVWDESQSVSDITGGIEKFLLACARKSKEANSDTYATWRDALSKLYFDFDYFDEGAQREKVDDWIDSIWTAYKHLWVDLKLAPKASSKPRRVKADSNALRP